MRTPSAPPRPTSLLALAAFAVTLPLMTAAAAPATKPPLGSGVFAWDALTVTPTRTGERREVFDGPTRTLAKLECHATTLNPGAAPHAPHRHADEEMLFVKEGALDVTINGVVHHAGPGAVVFFASNDLHGLRNPGTAPATYYVLRCVPRDLQAAAASR